MHSCFISKRKRRSYYFFVAFILVLNSCNKQAEENPPALLELMPSENTGINFINKVPETRRMNIFSYTNYYNGGGVATGDINNDGLVDIYLSSNNITGQLYLNKGKFKFEDITKGSGLDTLSGWKTGVTMVDINQDGLLDIYICRSGKIKAKGRRNLLFINNGDLTFTESANKYGVGDPGFSTQAAFFDYDMDGDLDMYLLNHNPKPSTTIIRYNDFDIGKYAGDKLYKNNNGYYEQVTESAGIRQSILGDGLGLAVSDFNNDGAPDIYICNDFGGRDYVYLNASDGTFKERAHQALGHISFSSMGSDMADFDNDGWSDLLVLDMRSSTNYGKKINMAPMDSKSFKDMVEGGGHYQYMINTLQLNNGNGTFSDIAPLAGVSSTDWSWAPLFVDLDNDGFKDLFITNGMRKNTNNKDFNTYSEKRRREEFLKEKPNYAALMVELLAKIPSEKVTNYVYKNKGDLTFEQSNTAWGVNLPTYSNGAAYADLDNDGDMDLVVNNIDDIAHIYRNNATELTGNYFLRVRLKGSQLNLNGIGAKVMVQTKWGRQYLEQYVSRGFQSSVDYTLHFGVGKTEVIDLLKVIWPDGKESELTHLAANQLVTVDYSSAVPPLKKAKETKPLLFSDVTNVCKIDYRHTENDYDDFKKEVLLPHKMSTFGPALAVGDINNDGLDDFFIGGASQSAGAIYVQNKEGFFTKTTQKALLSDKVHEDMDALFLDADSDGDLDLYVVSGGNEQPAEDTYYQDRLYLNNGKGFFTKSTKSLPNITASGGVVRAYDFDADGDLDLFVGGRQLPGKYPKPGRSYLLENENGIFKDVTTAHTSELEYPGMVTDALWSDYNGDGNNDLVLTGEWMPITIFENTNGTLTKIKGDSVLNNSGGWWFSIAEGDVNKDGRPDYIVGNLGENYKYKANPGNPFRLYSKDFDNNGTLDIVLSYYENDTLYPLRGKQCSSEQIPGLKKKFKDYNSFGLATLADIYETDSLRNADLLEAKTFSSSLLLNTTSGFKLNKLPKLAQISAVFGIVYTDFDKDGYEDIVLAGNLYNSEVETPRNDAGQGLFLKGDGKGGFTAVRGYESGLYILGDVKKLKAIKLGTGATAKKGILAGINNDFVRLIAVNK